MSVVIKVSSSSMSNQLSNVMNNAMADVVSYEQAISNNGAITTFRDVAANNDVTGVLLNSVQLSNINESKNHLDIMTSEMNILTDVMLAIDDALQDFAQILMRKMNVATQSAIDVVAASNNTLATLQTLLNYQFNGIYLFGGSTTDSPPVGDIVDDTSIVSSAYTSNYYLGDNTYREVIVNETATFVIDINASDPMFKTAIGALNSIKNAGNAYSTGNYAVYQSALLNINATQDSIAAYTAIIGANIQKLENESAKNDRVYTTLVDAVNSIMIESQPHLIQSFVDAANKLQAAIQIAAKINDSSMQVANYIK